MVLGLWGSMARTAKATPSGPVLVQTWGCAWICLGPASHEKAASSTIGAVPRTTPLVCSGTSALPDEHEPDCFGRAKSARQYGEKRERGLGDHLKPVMENAQVQISYRHCVDKSSLRMAVPAAARRRDDQAVARAHLAAVDRFELDDRAVLTDDALSAGPARLSAVEAVGRDRAMLAEDRQRH